MISESVVLVIATGFKDSYNPNMKMKSLLRTTMIASTLTILIASASLSVATAVTPVPTMTQVSKPDVFITEVQTASTASASEEFIEFFNDTDHDIDFADAAHGKKTVWKLQYFTGTKVTNDGVSDWSKPTGSIDLSAMESTVIPAHDYYLLAASKTDGSAYQPGGIEAEGRYSAKLSDAAAIQLVDIVATTAVTTVHDRLVWQKTPVNVTSYPAPPAGSSLQRMTTDDIGYQDTETKALTKFTMDMRISPKDSWLPIVIDETPTDEPPSDDTGTGAIPDPITNLNADTPLITEVLPNPASPQTDANDEFIELYNPGATPFDLYGYILETGTTTLHDFTFSEHLSIASKEYVAIYAKDTHLSLSNSGGQVRLLSPQKIKIYETLPYGTAPDGQSWSLIGTAWQWTASLTPNAANVLATIMKQQTTSDKAKAAAKVKGVTTTRTTKTKKTTTKKTVKTKVKKAKAKKKTNITQAKTNFASVVKPTPIHAGVLATIALAAVLYALYEYRVDLANYYHKLRRH